MTSRLDASKASLGVVTLDCCCSGHCTGLRVSLCSVRLVVAGWSTLPLPINSTDGTKIAFCQCQFAVKLFQSLSVNLSLSCCCHLGTLFTSAFGVGPLESLALFLCICSTVPVQWAHQAITMTARVPTQTDVNTSQWYVLLITADFAAVDAISNWSFVTFRLCVYCRMYSLMDSSRVSTFLIPMLLIVYGSFR